MLTQFKHLFVIFAVVPHTGDVGRNSVRVPVRCAFPRSSPIRGTWVEMPPAAGITAHRAPVVPHTGDVGRNEIVPEHEMFIRRSSPIRGTWVEIA